MNTRIRADLLIDAALFTRIEEYAHRVGMTPDEVFAESAEALLQHIERGGPGALDQVRVRALCETMGWTDYRAFPSGRDACIGRYIFTAAILADLTPDGFGDRCCYETVEQARAALLAWDGAENSEPQGWHRHPNTGRRRPNGDASREQVDR